MTGLVGFILGTVFGGSTAGIGVYGYMKRKYEKELDELHARLDSILAPVPEEEDDVPSEYKRVKKEEPKDADEEAPKLTKDDMNKIREKLRRNNAETIAYSKMYESPKDIVDAQADADAENGEPIPGEEESEEPEKGSEAKVTNIFEEVKKGKARAPRIVKESEVDANPEGWDVIALFLYNDGTITNEEDVVYDDEMKQKMLGNCLTKYDFVNSEEKLIYVQCFEMNAFYEINKFDKAFEK